MMRVFRRGKPKILVEIIHENNVITRKKCPINGNTVIINKGRAGHFGWCPQFSKDSLLLEPRFFSFRQKLIVRENAEKCLEFKEKETELPYWDKYALRKFMEAEVASKLGNVKIKHELPLVFWLLIACSILNTVLLLMIARGIMRFV